MKKALVVAIPVLVLALWAVVSYFAYNNQDVGLRNRAAAEEDVRQAVYDTMWKILKDKAGVSEAYVKNFKEIYPQLIEGRYGDGGGGLMKFISESNPDFKTELYKDLMVSIEAERTKFFNAQKLLRDIKREHDNLLAMAPSRWFVSNRTPIEVQIITGTNTKEVFQSGSDDQQLFDN